MDIVEITEDNKFDNEELFDADAMDDIGRECCKAIAAVGAATGEAVGALLWEMEEGGLRSRLSYYKQDSKAVGRALIDAYSERLDKNVVSSYFEFEGIDEEARAVFEDAGFEVSEAEAMDLHLTVGDLRALKVAKSKTPSFIKSIKSLDVKQFWQGISNALYSESRGFLDDLDYLPMEYFEQTVSSYVEMDGRVKGMLLVHRLNSGPLIPVLFYAVGPESSQNLLLMMRYSIQAAKIYCDDTPVLIRRHDDKTRALSSYLFPKKAGPLVVRGERRESGDS